jgi:NADPH:quinone reductase-like Zn-dependent oxidoreductase
MKAIQIHAYGRGDRMMLATVPRPNIGKGQILVKIHDAGVNPVDWKIREGYLKDAAPKSFPFTLGQDFSGEVVEADAAVSGFRKGEGVFGFAQGSYAEYAVASPEGLAHKPSSVDFLTAAAIPTAGLTSWQIIMDVARVTQKQTVLIHGAGGGVGSLAVQFARLRGARVIATASGDDMSYLRSLGVEQVIDYRSERFEEKVKDVDVVIDLVGGDVLARSYRVLKKGGLLITAIGPADEAQAKKLGVRAIQFVMKRDPSELDQIAKLIERGAVKPRISKVLPLAEAREADNLSQTGHPHGKIVLQVA